MRATFTITLLVLTIIGAKLRATDLPAPLPEFIDSSQTGKWMAAKAAATKSVVRASTQFYTGKPYVADVEGYVFKYRTYNPIISRWTSADPSGFPDGANNSAYAPVATSELDPNGLITVNRMSADDYPRGGMGLSGEIVGIDLNLGTPLNIAHYFGVNNAVADGGSNTPEANAYGYFNSYVSISGRALLGGSATVSPEVVIGVDVPSGTLRYQPRGSRGNSDGVVGALIEYVVEGAQTDTVTFHTSVTFTLNATQLTGIGAEVIGGSLSVDSTIVSVGPIALGSFTFRE